MTISVTIRSASDPSPRQRTRWISLLVAVLASGWSAYHLLGIQSDAAAERVYRASESCALVSVDPTTPAQPGACRREFAVIIGRKVTGGGTSSWPRYYLKTRASDGTRETTRVTTYNAAEFLKRVRVDDRIALLRFVAPGYRLTGEIIAFGDSLGNAGTEYRPDSRARRHGFLAVLGIIVVIGAVITHYAAIKASGQWPYTAERRELIPKLE
jgi:hypothetical protein